MVNFASLALGLALVTGSSAAAQAPVVSPPPSVTPSPAAAAGAAFLAANAKAPGVVTLPSGLQYKVITSGPKTGPSPKLGDIIKVHYEGKLLDGTVFDSSFERKQAAIMPLDGLVQAWLEALPMMHVGDEWVLYVPSELGYGERETGPIPAGSVMVFRLQLLGMLSVD
jgi:FKBP-type peptidyl-prolyl cis-trans isomerase